MVYQIVWTPKALETYVENIRYLEQNWTVKEVSKFVFDVENKLFLLSQHPEIGRSGGKKILISDESPYTNEYLWFIV